MTETTECGQCILPKIIVPNDNFFDIETVNQTFINMFDKKYIPILPCDMPAIEKISKLLHPFYVAHVTNESGIYNFTLIKNGHAPCDYVVDIIMYANQKIFINAKVVAPGFCWEYTQNTYNNIIRQVSTLNGHDTVRVYDTAKGEYLPDAKYIIAGPKDLRRIPQSMHNLGNMLSLSYPYVIGYCANWNAEAIEYCNDIDGVSWKMIHAREIGYPYCCFELTKNDEKLSCMFKSTDLQHTISECQKLCTINFSAILIEHTIEKYESITYAGSDVTFLSNVFAVFFGENNVSLTYLEGKYEFELHFVSDENDALEKGYTVEIEYEKMRVAVSTTFDRFHVYNFCSPGYSYKIITSDPISDVLYKLFSIDAQLMSVACGNEHIRFDKILNIDIVYISVHHFLDDKTTIRKQIYDMGDIVFDGIVTCTPRGTFVSNTYTSPNNYEHLLNGEKIPAFGTYSHSSLNKCSDVIKKILVNKCKPNAVARGQNIFNVPDFVINQDDYMCKEYIDLNYNKLCICRDGVTLIYGKDNTLIAESEVGRYHIAYDFKTGEKLSVQTFSHTDEGLQIQEHVLHRGYELFRNVEYRDGHLNAVFSIFKESREIYCGIAMVESANPADILKLYSSEQNSHVLRDFSSKEDSDAVARLNTELSCYTKQVGVSDIQMHYEGIVNCFESLSEERIEETIIHDEQNSFKFLHILLPKNIDGKGAEKTVVTHTNEKGSAVNFHQHNYDINGHYRNRKMINSANQFVVKSNLQKNIYEGHVGYKAARTSENKKCVVKLYVSGDSKIAWEPISDKYRTNFATVMSIKLIKERHGKFYLERDLLPEECPICRDAIATHVSIPCRHKFCSKCWERKFCDDKKCYLCRGDVTSVMALNIDVYDGMLGEIRKNGIVYQDTFIPEAYSFIHTGTFVYRAGDPVIETQFDGNLDKTCLPGIHYHENLEDVFKWFEYMDIPAELRVAERTVTPGTSILDAIIDTDVSLKKRKVPKKSLNIQDSSSSEDVVPVNKRKYD